MLKVDSLESGYGSMQVLWKPSLSVKKGSVTSLLGSNGVGKTTLLNTIFGSVRPWGGKIIYEERDVTHLSTHGKVKLGIVLSPEGKHLFGKMSVHQNLLMGAYLKEAMKCKNDSLHTVYTLFPILQQRTKQSAGSLSGGEQQMLTIARALMTRPKLIMLDEPSQGLAPLLVREVFSTIEKMTSQMNLTVLLVEQNAEGSLSVTNCVYIMHEGQIKAEGSADEIRRSSDIKEAYLGI